jgi:hypothetical protein
MFQARAGVSMHWVWLKLAGRQLLPSLWGSLNHTRRLRLVGTDLQVFGYFIVIAMPFAPSSYPVTPDGRYFVVRGRLWRRASPDLSEEDRVRQVSDLMRARRQVALAQRTKNEEAERQARQAVDVAKRALGERGPVWWHDGSPDYNRRLARNTPYAGWFATLDTA